MTTKEPGAAVRVPPPLVFLAFTLTAIAADRYVMPLGAPGARLVFLAAGIVLMALGVTTVVSARVLFFRTRQNPVPWTPTPELIARGPYRFTRHPMYVGVTTLLVGVGAVSDVLWISLLAPIALLAVHFLAVVKEEAYLAAKFGDSYAAYAARVRRYV